MIRVGCNVLIFIDDTECYKQLIRELQNSVRYEVGGTLIRITQNLRSMLDRCKDGVYWIGIISVYEKNVIQYDENSD